MAPSPTPIRYQDLASIPAERLLQLRYCELNQLITQAQQEAQKAEHIIHWLQGIKIEKSLRYGGNDD